MNASDVLSVVKNRIDVGVGVLSIDAELAGVLLDISSRAEFLTDFAVIETVADNSDYAQPDDMKSIYEVSVGSGALLDKITYRQYLEFVEQATVTAGVPTKYALRHGKLWLWPVPDDAKRQASACVRMPAVSSSAWEKLSRASMALQIRPLSPSGLNHSVLYATS